MEDLTRFQNPLTTRGDVIVEDSSPKPARLARGAAWSVFSMAASGLDAAWQAISAVIDSLGSPARGAILYRGASGWLVLNAGTAGQALLTNGAGADPSWGTAVGTSLKGARSGFEVSKFSNTQAYVAPGTARDSTNAGDIQLASYVTLDLSAVGAAGHERKSLSATVSTGGPNVNGNGGSTFLTDWAPSGTPRVLTGTVSFSGGTTGTGTGTRFLTESAVGDVVGTASAGYARVTAIASDVSLTTSSALTTSGACNVLENPQIEVGGSVCQVDAIASNVILMITSSLPSLSNVSAWASAGAPSGWFAFWAGSGGSGTTVFGSSQRTAPLSPPTGYSTFVRRLAMTQLDGSAHLVAFATSPTLVSGPAGSIVELDANGLRREI